MMRLKPQPLSHESILHHPVFSYPITGEGSSIIDPLKGIDGAMLKNLFPWHFNVCRQRVRGTTIERTAFSATGKDDFYVPEKFAKLWGKGK